MSLQQNINNLNSSNIHRKGPDRKAMSEIIPGFTGPHFEQVSQVRCKFDGNSVRPIGICYGW